MLRSGLKEERGPTAGSQAEGGEITAQGHTEVDVLGANSSLNVSLMSLR